MRCGENLGKWQDGTTELQLHVFPVACLEGGAAAFTGPPKDSARPPRFYSGQDMALLLLGWETIMRTTQI